MIIELDDSVYMFENKTYTLDEAERTTRFVRSLYNEDEWIVFSEDEYGDLTIKMMTETDLVETFGNLP